MITLRCDKCNKEFERRGLKRGGKPHCNDCRAKAEYERRFGSKK